VLRLPEVQNPEEPTIPAEACRAHAG
jgi:hypothetical protein